MSNPENDGATMPFTAHVAELRRRVFVSLIGIAVACVIAFIFYNSFIPYLIKPLEVERPDGDHLKLYVHEFTGAFAMRFKVAGLVGLVLSFPVHVYNIVAFVLPALRPRERQFLKWGLAVSSVLILTGAYMSFYQILPLAARVLQGPDFYPAGVESNIKFETAIMFEFKLIMAFLVLFQLPLVLEILMAAGVLTRRQLLRASRYVIVAIFIIAAIFTPPDVISQIGLAVPLILLFYLSILVARILGFGKEKTSDSDI